MRLKKLMIATPNPPYIGAFESNIKFIWIYQSFWQGVSYNNSNSFTRNNGPFKGTLDPYECVETTDRSRVIIVLMFERTEHNHGINSNSNLSYKKYQPTYRQDEPADLRDSTRHT
ncbi:hypothetical protein DFA_03413 [Cavenderia fasciculata]|uniref:Uncharacterized protein n=1 Tax=Cavenderia fasciculata TaxID=261658 RepID=F4PHI1_CACFS|nr:uncharacterized protein DFA_03413 [Cavenderia fasciculata]EGG25165.1 hypothetical protein DFA_03413 [Cavenderia fasciculata]|eukprot:XP_004363016.1 hypothetical protein DFA_03413 [Cavenderia fasciculata]